MFIRRSQKFINTMLSILVMEGIVFVYIFKTISFAGLSNEYSQFACLQQLIRCFLFANVTESYRVKSMCSASDGPLCNPVLTVSSTWVDVGRNYF